ncbi:hypothetical protein JCM21900_005594 [Sporobolomyces salmonicolor]
MPPLRQVLQSIVRGVLSPVMPYGVESCPLTLSLSLSAAEVDEPPFFLGCSVALALRYALKSARFDAGHPASDLQEFRFPMTGERLRLAAGDFLAKKGEARAHEGEEGKGWFVHI